MENRDSSIAPVVTIVLYFGTDQRWSGPRSLKQLLPIPESLDPYVNDYRIHVFEVAWLDDETVAKFKSDFRIVANFFVNKRKNKDYIPDDRSEIKHVDAVLKLLSVMTGDHRYETIYTTGKEGAIKNMCDVAERLEKRGIEKGIEKGIQILLIEQVCKKMKKGYPVSDIADMLEEDKERIQKICDVAAGYAPDYDVDSILKDLSD